MWDHVGMSCLAVAGFGGCFVLACPRFCLPIDQETIQGGHFLARNVSGQQHKTKTGELRFWVSPYAESVRVCYVRECACFLSRLHLAKHPCSAAARLRFVAYAPLHTSALTQRQTQSALSRKGQLSTVHSFMTHSPASANTSYEAAESAPSTWGTKRSRKSGSYTLTNYYNASSGV